MKLRTLNRIIEWGSKYQPHLTNEEGTILYEKLIIEEREETKQAKLSKNLVEYLDGLGDTLWVQTLYNHFDADCISMYSMDVDGIVYNIANNLKYEGHRLDVLDDLINTIANSNFTKSLDLQTEGEKVGKVIKGKEFIPPDIKSIIDKYEIEWKR